MSMLALCENEVTLYRQTITQGQSGGQNPSMFVVDSEAVNVPVSIQPSSASTQLRYMQRQMVVSHTLYFEDNWQARTGNRWVTEGGLVYVVRGWSNSVEVDDNWTCDCELIDVPGRVRELP